MKLKDLILKETGDLEIVSEIEGSFKYGILTKDNVYFGCKVGFFSAFSLKTFPLDSITSVEIKSGPGGVGEIEIIMPGGREANGIFANGIARAANENVMMFRPKQNAEEIRRFVKLTLDLRDKKRNPAPTPVTNNLSIPEQIRQLSDLAKDGIITNSEFESKKSELLSKM
jgi:hypothetical protein